MAERSREKPTDPKLLKCQVAFKALSDEILQEKPDAPGAYFGLSINADPQEVLERLKSSPLRDMLLQDGEFFSATISNNETTPELGVAGDAPTHSITLVHGNWQEPKYRYNPDSPRRKPYKVQRFEGEFDWTRELVMRIWYGEGKVAQDLLLKDDSRNAGMMPSLLRAIYASDYAEIGYEGHHLKQRCFRSQKEAMFFINLARELFNKREQS